MAAAICGRIGTCRGLPPLPMMVSVAPAFGASFRWIESASECAARAVKQSENSSIPRENPRLALLAGARGDHGCGARILRGQGARQALFDARAAHGLESRGMAMPFAFEMPREGAQPRELAHEAAAADALVAPFAHEEAQIGRLQPSRSAGSSHPRRNRRAPAAHRGHRIQRCSARPCAHGSARAASPEGRVRSQSCVHPRCAGLRNGASRRAANR